MSIERKQHFHCLGDGRSKISFFWDDQIYIYTNIYKPRGWHFCQRDTYVWVLTIFHHKWFNNFFDEILFAHWTSFQHTVLWKRWDYKDLCVCRNLIYQFLYSSSWVAATWNAQFPISIDAITKHKNKLYSPKLLHYSFFLMNPFNN